VLCIVTARRREARLRLDVRERQPSPRSKARRSCRGDVKKSEIISRIFNDSPEVMPPPTSHKSLTPAQKELLKK
jgi:hypothetical protein